MHYAAQQGYGAVVQALLAVGGDINRQDKLGSTPLHAAASGGRLEAVRVLMAKGAKVKLLDETGATPADVAAAHGHRALVNVLGGVSGGSHRWIWVLSGILLCGGVVYWLHQRQQQKQRSD